jgi:molybdenum cofactor biosynthesis protein B
MALDDLVPSSRKRSIAAAVLTVSDTRTLTTDTSGAAAQELLVAAGHRVVTRELVRDDQAEVARVVTSWTRRDDIRVALVTGGTGIARRDVTIEAVTPLYSKELVGFGEIFRARSYREIGPAAMLSRASAGIVGSTAVFLLPGSEAAVRLAVAEIILPQVEHLARELEK